MLRFVLGIAGTGKTTLLMDEIAARAAQGQESILLVPEQFSSSAEAMAYRRLGDVQSGLVQVLSFRTLAERILKTSGGAGRRVLTDAGRVVFVRRALDVIGPELRTFVRQRRSAAFCSMCAQTLAELKTAGATPARLREIARQDADDKLEELALIYEAYEAQLADVALDPEDRLSFAAQKADGGFLTGRACYIDSFDGFTAPEYTLLAQLLAHCPAVVVALCCDSLQEPSWGPDAFTPVRRAAARLQGLAAMHGDGRVMAPMTLALPKRALHPVLEHLNLLLACPDGAEALTEPDVLENRLASGGAPPEPELSGVGIAGDGVAGMEGACTVPDGVTEAAGADVDGLWLTEAADEWEELRAVAARMRQLALAGVPYSRMAVICRDMEAYERVARRQLALFDVPVFFDASGTIEYTAPVAFLRAALLLLRQGISSRGVLALLKTGLCGFTEEAVAALENYVYTWEPKAADWRAPFTGNPEGLLAELTAEAAGQLALAEGLRGKVVPVLEDFIRHGREQTVRGLSRRLYLLLEAFDAGEHMDSLAITLEARGETAYADRSRRAWDLAMGLLDEMVALMGDDRLEAGEYDEMLLLLVRATDFGQAPQTLESAVLTTADRMRLDEPDYCFVVGLAEGEFPMQVGYSGLLTHHDREKLVSSGIEMPGSFENRTLLEELFFYRALTAPRRGLYVSWPKRRAGGPKAMSAALERVKLALAPGPLELPPTALAATPAAAFDLLGTVYRDNSTLAASLHSALAGIAGANTVVVEKEEQNAVAWGGQSEHSDAAQCKQANAWDPRALDLLRAVDNPGSFAVADSPALRRLVGEELRLSATVAESYYRCRFAYYMERVLRVRPRSRAVVSPLESGTFVHHVLEQVLREAATDFALWSNEQLAEAAGRYAEAFIAENLPVVGNRAAWQLGQIRLAMGRLLCYMRDAAAHSDFTIDALELAIGGGEDEVPPLELETADGRRLRVSGKIDRVDVLRQDGKTYLCIVDYKTGSKKFSMEDVYCGLNMQMMIYMATLCQNAGSRYPGAVPAGVLYLSADPRPESGGREGDARPIYHMDGLLLHDTELLHQMDQDGTGIFLPVRYNKDGRPRAGAALADEETFDAVLAHVQAMLAGMADGVYEGQFPARPLVKGSSSPCAYCPYRPACRHEDGVNETAVEAPADAFAPAAEQAGASPAGGEDAVKDMTRAGDAALAKEVLP